MPLGSRATRVVVLGVPTEYFEHAKPDAILSRLGLDGAGIADSTRRALARRGRIERAQRAEQLERAEAPGFQDLAGARAAAWSEQLRRRRYLAHRPRGRGAPRAQVLLTGVVDEGRHPERLERLGWCRAEQAIELARTECLEREPPL